MWVGYDVPLRAQHFPFTEVYRGCGIVVACGEWEEVCSWLRWEDIYSGWGLVWT